MTAHGPRHEDAQIADSRRTATEEWAILVRPRHSKREYLRQIMIDVVLVGAVLLIVALLS